MEIIVNSVEESLQLGQKMANAFIAMKKDVKKLPQAIYMYGDLGAGKTTLTRGIVSALPHGDEAEVASPSFTLCHEYPTDPEVFHADLYRLPNPCFMPEELVELPENTLLIIEWAERLQKKSIHAHRIDLHFSVKNTEYNQEISSEKLDNFVNSCEKKCLICLTAHGDVAMQYINYLQRLL